MSGVNLILQKDTQSLFNASIEACPASVSLTPQDSTVYSLGQNTLHPSPSTAQSLQHLTCPPLNPYFIENSPAAIEVEAHLDEETLEQKLKNWIEEAPAGIENFRRQSAADKIRAAYNNKSFNLDLKELRLSTLPDIFDLEVFKEKLHHLNLRGNLLRTLPDSVGSLAALQNLDLYGNRLEALPNTIGQLTNLHIMCLRGNLLKELPGSFWGIPKLEHLNLNDNPIAKLPDTISNLVNLRSLLLLNCGLKTVPESIGDLIFLQSLDLRNNQMIELPSSVGYLTQLVSLEIQDNSGLMTLPLSLGNCGRLRDIDTSGTAIPEYERSAIVASCRAARDAEGALALPVRLATWKGYNRLEYDLSFLSNPSNFSVDQQKLISKWLLKLEGAKDFDSKRKKLAKLVCDILVTLAHHSTEQAVEFKDAFFSDLEDNLCECGDRAAMLLNLIYTKWKLWMDPAQSNDVQKIEIMIGIAKTITLRNELQDRIKRLKADTNTIEESVEIYLYYETLLKDRLGLITAIEHMHHAPIGKRPDINEDDLIACVNEYYLDTLVNIPAIEKILEKNPQYIAETKLIIAHTAKKMTELDESLKNPKQNEKEGDYLIASENIRSSRELALAELKKQYIKPFLPNKK